MRERERSVWRVPSNRSVGRVGGLSWSCGGRQLCCSCKLGSGLYVSVLSKAKQSEARHRNKNQPVCRTRPAPLSPAPAPPGWLTM